LFNVLATVAEFESDLIRLRTREGIKIAKAKGRLRGRRPKLKPKQARTHAGFAELFGVRRSTVNRTIEPRRPKPPEPERPFARLEHPEE
jgi:DNA invertase Pin-like site-specific DNA recombinase